LSAAAFTLLRLVRDTLGLNASRIASRLSRRIFRKASLSRCDATCCKGGVAVSTAERDAIILHRDAVARAMEASARPGVAPAAFEWFTSRVRRDPDFLVGRSVDTRVVAGACVFLRADRLCAVHAASEEILGHAYALKPAYCILFPLEVEKGSMRVCRGSFTRRPECCSPVRNGPRSAVDLFGAATRRLRTAPRRLSGPR
jgi:Fe-S-cluster containining protein